MSKWLAVAAVLTVVTGCNFGAQSFTCTDDLSCGPSGQCEPGANLCSFPDGACPSGRRFGDLAGGQSNQCVGDEVPIDAAIDAPIDVLPPIDARVCFGNAPFTICLAAAPMAALTIAADTKIDTATSPMCAATMSGAADYCVLVGTTITISARLRGIGTKPLVLLASDSITVSGNGLIDVGNRRGDPEVGAGANPSVCVAGSAPGTRGGGSGGSFTGRGGQGGAGGGGGGAGGLAALGVGTANITTVRGGCPGHEGQGNDRGAGGRGGGAVFLIAGTRMDIGGRGIHAGGEGGGFGTRNGSGGGGGGSGGMIGFDAPTVAGNALLLASGGGGGEGAGDQESGGPGSDVTETDPANGGGGAQLGGNGGNGSSALAAGPGAPANAGGTAGGNTDGGGGGGGGAAGIIKAPANATLGNLLSPPATP